MGKRFSCAANSFKGFPYVIEIWDSSFSGSSTDFNVADDMFSLRQVGETQKPTSPMIATECSFTMMIENATHEALITDLASAIESRFLVRITKSGALHWCGVLIPDNTSQEDEAYPYGFEIHAVCGLSFLKKQPYYNSGVLYTGVQSFVNHCLNSLNKIPTATAFYTSGDKFLRTSVDWWSLDTTRADGTDPFDKYGADHVAFYDFHTSGGVDKDVLNCYDVLQEIMKTFCAHIVMLEGVWWVRQPSYMISGYVGRNWDRAGAYINYDSLSGTNTVNQTITKARLSGGKFDYFPALRKAAITYNIFNRINLYTGNQIKSNQYAFYNGADFTRDISDGGDAVLTVRTNANVRIRNQSYVATLYNGAMVVFKMRLDVGSKRWANTYTKTNFTINYTTAAWEDTSLNGYFYFHVPFGYIPAAGSSMANIQPITISTAKLLASGSTYSLHIYFHAVEKAWEAGTIPASSGVPPSVALDVEFDFQAFWLELYDSGTPDTHADSIIYTTQGDSGNSEVEEIETRLGGPATENTVGRIRYWNGTIWETADAQWGLGAASPTIAIGALLSGLVLQQRRTPLRRCSMTIQGDLLLYRRFTFDGIDWLMMGGTWNAAMDEINGEFYELSYGAGGTVDPPVKVIITGIHTYPDPPLPGGGVITPSGDGFNGFAVKPPPTVLYPVANNFTDTAYAKTTVMTSVGVTIATTGTDYAIGDVFSLVNPMTGQFDQLTVTAAPTVGSMAIAVSGTLTADYPQNSYLIKKPIAYAYTLPNGTLGRILRHNGTTWVAYAGVTAGHVLTWDATNGAIFAAPSNAAITLSGDVTGSGATAITTTIAANAVTDAKFRQSAALSIVGRSANSTGNVADIVAANDGEVLRRSGTTLGFGTVATNGITNSAVTYAKIQNVSTNNRILGRITGGAGVVEELTAANLQAICGYITGTLTSGRVALSTGTNTVGDNANLTFNGTQLIIGTGAAAAFLNVFAGSITGATEFLRMSGAINGNMIASISNSHNANTNSNTIFQIKTGGSAAGDPIIQFSINGQPGWAMGVDNSDGDKFKFAPAASVPGENLNSGLIIANAIVALVGINKDTPLYPLDVAGVVRSTQYVGVSAAWSASNVAFGAGNGTGGTLNSISGTLNSIQINWNTGTSPTTDGLVMTVAYPTGFPSGLTFPVMMQKNKLSASDFNKFYISNNSNLSFQISANGTLAAPPSGNYSFNIVFFGIG